jgi:NodT family efflux transporter outer membrane factor (OMF) lipoprotein
MIPFLSLADGKTKESIMRLMKFLHLGALALLGCAVGPDYETPRPALPKSWSSLEEKREGQGSLAMARTAEIPEWWQAFADPVLTSIAERALAANLDLREAAARVREARALRGVALGGLLPEAGVSGSYERAHISENGTLPSDGRAIDLYQAGFDASWEIDVFGGNRRRLEAAEADVQASLEALRDVRVSLLAEVARSYVELRGYQARIAIARQNLEAQKNTAQLTRARLDAGQTTELDVARAEAQVSTTSSAIPALEVAALQTIHGIALLLAREPEALATELSASAPIPNAPPEIPVGLPTDLLRRRPDIRQAERELAAATARIGVATADLYPRFFLIGSLGADSVKASDFFNAGSRAWSIGPEIRWSLFQGGRIRASIEVQNARQERAALRFEQTLLRALRNVEDALIAHSREQLRRAMLAQAVASQRRAVELADQRYTQGLVDFLSVLEAQRALYAAHDALVQSEQAIATDTIALYKAVGGGWRPEEEERKVEG